jgi:hypothetical protein
MRSACPSARNAVSLWQNAGEMALKRMALTETISHLNRGLELVAILSHSRERDTSELALRTNLGIAWQTLIGPAAPEVWSSFHPALALAKSLQRTDALLPILDGLMYYVMAQGRVVEALQWAEKMLDLAKSSGDADLLIVGHTEMVGCYICLGRLVELEEHCDKVLELYDDDKHYHLADIISPDPKTLVLNAKTTATWILGYPDGAVRIGKDLDAHAHGRAHPFDLGWALTFGCDLFDLRCEPEEIRKRAEECERLGCENSLPFLSACFAPLCFGVASIREGSFAEGIASLMAGLAVWDSIGGKLWSPHFKGVLAQGKALAGGLDDALQLIDEQLEQVERPGWEERVYYAEILRLKGWMLTLKDDLDGAEKNYPASLDWAREQQAKSWELRTSTGLARLWQSQGKVNEAHELLAPIYNWFTEGFDTKDLIEAKALLEKLEA